MHSVDVDPLSLEAGRRSCADNTYSDGTTTDASRQQEGLVVAESISSMIGESLKSFSSKPEDLIRLGMGIGASLGAQGFLSLQPAASNAPAAVPDQEQVHEGEEHRSLGQENDSVSFMSCSSEEMDERKSGEDSYLEDDAAFDSIAPSHANLLRYAKPAPEGLLEIIAATRVGKKQVEYLSHTFDLNLPQIRTPELAKPVAIADEWKESGYNPWSQGRPKTSSEFVRSLASETKKWPRAVNRLHGPTGEDTDRAFASLCTMCRHGKHREAEDLLDQLNDKLSIDFCDEAGNTLLMIASQNGNKRVAKLCLRRGAQINKQNLNGNTCLHFAFGYGFGGLAEYLISKGADPSLVNSNGLTCYEFAINED